MPKPCTVCRHHNREHIDRALLAGVPYRTLAAQHNLSASALCRHMRHLVRYREGMLHHEDQQYNQAMLDKIDLLEVRLSRIFQDAHHNSSLRVALDCIREYAKLLALQQKFRVRLPH